MITQEQVDENRQKWLAVLRAPESSKAVGVLESRTDENSRCCLGHACHALGITRTVTTGPDMSVMILKVNGFYQLLVEL